MSELLFTINSMKYKKRGTVCPHLQAEVRRMNPSNKDDKNSSTLTREAVTSPTFVTPSPYVGRTSGDLQC